MVQTAEINFNSIKVNDIIHTDSDSSLPSECQCVHFSEITVIQVPDRS
jgi:hypothetical protein